METATHQSDEEILIQALKSGNEADFQKAVRLYTPRHDGHRQILSGQCFGRGAGQADDLPPHRPADYHAHADTLTVVLAMGAPASAVMIFEVLLNATSMFNHGNVRLPLRFDRYLRLFVVTPDMHRVHHSVIVRETESNFGFNLPWWDRMLIQPFRPAQEKARLKRQDSVLQGRTDNHESITIHAVQRKRSPEGYL